jgi:hypothetical protein
LVKYRMIVKYRKSNGGYYISSVAMKRLVKMSSSGYRKFRWSFEPLGDKGGCLTLEAF